MDDVNPGDHIQAINRLLLYFVPVVCHLLLRRSSSGHSARCLRRPGAQSRGGRWFQLKHVQDNGQNISPGRAANISRCESRAGVLNQLNPR